MQDEKRGRGIAVKERERAGTQEQNEERRVEGEFWNVQKVVHQRPARAPKISSKYAKSTASLLAILA